MEGKQNERSVDVPFCQYHILRARPHQHLRKSNIVCKMHDIYTLLQLRVRPIDERRSMFSGVFSMRDLTKSGSPVARTSRTIGDVGILGFLECQVPLSSSLRKVAFVPPARFQSKTFACHQRPRLSRVRGLVGFLRTESCHRRLPATTHA